MTRPPGVWMIYHHDYYVHLDSIHTSLEEATQAHVEKGWGEVGYLPYGVELDAAVKAWERGEYKQEPLFAPDAKTPNEALDGLMNLAGISADSWQASALRYFLNDTVSEDTQ